MGGVARGLKIPAVDLQFIQSLVRCRIAFVGYVVGGSGKVLDRGNGRTQAGWAQPRCHRKILIMRDGRGTLHLRGYMWVTRGDRHGYLIAVLSLAITASGTFLLHMMWRLTPLGILLSRISLN